MSPHIELTKFYIQCTDKLKPRMPAAINLIALAALSTRESTEHLSPEGEAPQTNQIIPQLCSHARSIAYLACIQAYPAKREREAKPLADLAAQIKTNEIMVRNNQYSSIGSKLNKTILGDPKIAPLLIELLGFDYSDLCSVYATIRERYQNAKNAQLDKIRDLRVDRKNRVDLESVEMAPSVDAMRDFMINPGASSSFTATEISNLGQVSLERVQSILNLFSISPLSRSFEELVGDFVSGISPLSGKGLITDGKGRYLMLQDAIPIDRQRKTIEEKIKNTRRWPQYGRHRDKQAEEMARSSLSILGRYSKWFTMTNRNVAEQERYRALLEF